MDKIYAFILIILSFFHLFAPKVTTKIATIAPLPTFIQSDNLPNYHLIKTSFVPQAPEKKWDQPWQDACEEAAMLTVDYYYRGIKSDIPTMLADYQKIFNFESVSGWSHDVNLSQMATISASLFKLKPIIVSDPTVEIFKKYLSQDIPVIIPANGKILFKENSHFKSGGPWYHNLVVLGYDDTQQQFIVHDVGTQFGAYFHYSYKTLLDSIHDFPASGIKEDINTGAKKVLILIK